MTAALTFASFRAGRAYDERDTRRRDERNRPVDLLIMRALGRSEKELFRMRQFRSNITGVRKQIVKLGSLKIVNDVC